MLPDRDSLIRPVPVTIEFEPPPVDLTARSAGDEPSVSPSITFQVAPMGRTRYAELTAEATIGDRTDWDLIARELFIDCIKGVSASTDPDLVHEFTADDADDVIQNWPAHMYTTLLGAMIRVNQIGVMVPKATSPGTAPAGG